MKQIFLFCLVLLVSPSLAFGQQSELVSSFSTEFNGWNRRGTNVRLTGEKVNGSVVLPGEVFSYNKTVGERTEEAGFKKAHAYRAGRVVNELGGGACQLSSTLHAAALYAGLEIVEQHRHTRASRYIIPGLDATVSWSENKDLKFRNTYSSPITIKAFETNKGRIQVDIFARKPEFAVSLKFVTKKIIPFETKVKTVNTKPLDYEKEVEPGTLGYHMWRIRKIRNVVTRQEKTEKVFMFYPPASRRVEKGAP